MSEMAFDDALKQLKFEWISNEIFSILPSVMAKDSSLGQASKAKYLSSSRVAFRMCMYFTFEGCIPEVRADIGKFQVLKIHFDE